MTNPPENEPVLAEFTMRKIPAGYRVQTFYSKAKYTGGEWFQCYIAGGRDEWRLSAIPPDRWAPWPETWSMPEEDGFTSAPGAAGVGDPQVDAVGKALIDGVH